MPFNEPSVFIIRIKIAFIFITYSDKTLLQRIYSFDYLFYNGKRPFFSENRIIKLVNSM